MSALIYCPFPDTASADAAADRLLDEGLIVCANRLASVHSRFVWQGRRDTGEEVAVLFKTDASVLKRAVARLEALHPYEAPAVFGWVCEAVGAGTSAWTSALAEAGA